MDVALLPALFDALVVAQTGSVGEAARRLHKTASAVSQQLRRIEEHFGVALFEKVGRGVRPSLASETVLGSLTRLFDEAASLETQLGELAGAKISTLRVAASDYLGEALLLPVLRQLFAEGVALRFEITTTNSTEAARLVADGQVDVALVSRDRALGPDETFLCRQRFFWVAPRPRRGARQPIRGRLGREPLLRLDGDRQERRILDELLGRERLRPLSTIDVPSVSLMLSYARQGLGIGLVPELTLRTADHTTLSVEAADVPAIDVRLVCRPTLKRSKPVARFLDGLTDLARQAPPHDARALRPRRPRRAA